MNTTTKKGKSFTQLSKPLVAVLAIIVGGLALAITDAGTVIKNLATVSYTDSSGDDYVATSNEAEVIVAAVNSATLEGDNQTGIAAPGQTVYFPHVLTNTGNDTDTFTLLFGDDDLTNATGDTAGTGFTLYIDENGNGQPDAGEATIADGGTHLLDAGESVTLLLAVDIPVTADSGDIVDAALVAQGSGEVTDPGADLDGDIADAGSALGAIALDDATNQDAVTVTLGPVLVTTKSSELVPAGIEYTLTVKNTGGSAATNVDIFDAIPSTVTAFIEVTEVNGLLLANGDSHYVDGVGFTGDLTLASIATTVDFDEPLGVDMNDDGAVIGGAVTGIVLRDASLPANATVSIKYTVSIPSTAGAVFKNIFCAGQDITDPDQDVDADVGGDAATFTFGDLDIAQCSNQTVDEIPFTFGVTISDGTSADDVELVATGAVGGNVDFSNQITNNGSANDIIDLAIVGTTFPAGTVFTFWNSTAVVPLTDNNNNGIPDTGVIGPGGVVTITVRATIPQSITSGTVIVDSAVGTIAGGTISIDVTSGNFYLDKDTPLAQLAEGLDSTPGQINGYALGASTADDDELFQAIISATSSEDASQIDHKIEALGDISPPRVDLANSSVNGTGAGAIVPGFNDNGLADAHADATTIITYGNEDDADNFDEDATDAQAAPVSGNTGAATDGAVFLGQTISIPLFIANEGENLDAYELTVDTLPAGFEVVFKNTSGVIITATPALSADEPFSYTAEVLVLDSALAATHTFGFTVTSPTTGATNSIDDAIVVGVNCEVGITPASLQQIQAGGNVDYVHTFTNNTNVTGVFTIGVDLSDSAWTSLLVAVGAVGAVSDGNVIDDPTAVTLAPGASFSFINRVFAPANAINGQTEVSTVTIASSGGAAVCGDVVVQDVASVIVGQVRLDKTVTVDDNCDCAETTGFATSGASSILPGDCAIWRLVATNEGDETATSVVINDSITEFSALASTADGNTYNTGLPGHLVSITPASPLNTPTATAFKFCTGLDCLDGASLVASGGSITYANPTITFTVGTLAPGASAGGQFCVQVQ